MSQFIKCLPSHIRALVRGSMSKLSWSETIKLADEIYCDYNDSRNSLGETKIEIDGELNNTRVFSKKISNSHKFKGNCNNCGVYGHNGLIV